MDYKPEELLVACIARLLAGTRHVAVGMLSPIPGSGALLAQQTGTGATRVSVLGSRKLSPWTDGGVELFDFAGQGRLDAFFLSGGQIDGQANVNLVGVGDYPQTKVRWSGSFGSAYLYFVVPRVILFRDEHTRRVFVPKVDFVSAPGVSEPGVYRPGGPYALLTNLCLMDFDKERARFRLRSVHEGHTVEEVLDNTGFDIDVPAAVPTTEAPPAEWLALMRGPVARAIAEPYPQFAARVFAVAQAAE